ncbi:MAG TPA: VC0807 family protein [Solirubrobacteraceae bacterium]|nr:VC0807 family protein [Solirubrobacteraceae bacterium]
MPSETNPPEPSPTPLQPVAARAILRRTGPRLVRDGAGPIAAFYVGWKLIGLIAGITLATLFGLLVYRHERRSGRPAIVVRVALGLVLIRAIVGLISRDTTVYLGQEIALDALLGSITLGSLVLRRPLAAAFAREIYEFPEAMRESHSFTSVFRRVTAVWGVYFLLRGGVRLIALLTLSTGNYLLVAALSDAPFLLALLAWSVLYTGRRLRRSEEWGAAIAAIEGRAV